MTATTVPIRRARLVATHPAALERHGDQIGVLGGAGVDLQLLLGEGAVDERLTGLPVTRYDPAEVTGLPSAPAPHQRLRRRAWSAHPRIRGWLRLLDDELLVAFDDARAWLERLGLPVHSPHLVDAWT